MESCLQFLDTASNHRLGIFSNVAQVVTENMRPWEAYRALVATMRAAGSGKDMAYVEISCMGLTQGEFRVTRVWHGDGSESVADRTPWRSKGVSVRKGGVIAEIVGGLRPRVVLSANIPADDPIYAELGAYKSFAAVSGGLGDSHNWLLIASLTPASFDAQFLEDLVLRFGLITSVTKNLQTVRELRRATAFIDSELNRISAIQRALLPDDAPKVPGLEVAAFSETFDRAGGDLYDFAEMRDGRWALLVADASGHGPSAAVVAAMLNAILHAYPARQALNQPPAGPGEVLEFANAQLSDKRIQDSFVTAFLAFWDPKDRTFTYARAGHNPPMYRRATGEITEMNAVGSIPLSMFSETRYEQHEMLLSVGDVILLYTDGIIDAENEAAIDFGEHRLREALVRAKGSAAEILPFLCQEVQSHMGRTRPRDDQTLVVLHAV